jgi:hypothetical protein
LENICFKSELGVKQRDIHNRIVYAYCDRLKKLSNELKQMIKAQQPGIKNDRKDIYQGILFKISMIKIIFILFR